MKIFKKKKNIVCRETRTHDLNLDSCWLSGTVMHTGLVYRKSEDLKSILFIMFANLKLVLWSYTSLYGIFMSASLT